MKRIFGVALLMVIAAGLVPSRSWAQDVAAVTGVVTDANGALVVGAEVALVNTTTNAKYGATTSSQGSYTISDVLPGTGYKITFTKSGFEPVVVTDISLNVATTRTQNAKLVLGNVSQSLEVSAANSEVTLDTTDATIGNTFDVKLLNDLPVQTRDTPSALFTLQPGVIEGSVTGARTDQTDVTVDGLDVNDISTGQTFLIVANAPVDSVEEFKGTVAGSLVSSGPGGGGQYQLVTKSGSNKFHGDVNEYHRDTSTAANNWFNDEDGVPLAHYVQNQFGGQVGGPIKKDKAFFFFNFYDSRIAHSAPIDTAVPTPSYMAGNVSYIYANAGGGTTGAACSPVSRLNTTPSCIGTLTSAQVKALDPLSIGFSPVIKGFLGTRYTQTPNDPTYGDGINTEGYRFNAPEPNDETNYVARFDYILSPTMKFFAKTGINRQDAVEFPQILPSDPVLANPFEDRSYNYVAGYTWTIGANKVNEFYYGDTIEKFDFPATYTPSGTTVLTLGDYTSVLGDPYPAQQTQKRRIPIPVIRDDFNWTRGSHSMGFGGSFKFIKTESQQITDFNYLGLGLGGELYGLSPSLRPSSILNDANGTADSLYDSAYALAVGRVAAVDTNYNYNAAGMALPNGTGHIRRYRYYQTELYANDTWKVSKELTVTYGLHYQYYSVPYETQGLESVQPWTFDSYFGARVAQSQQGDESNSGVPFITYNLGGKVNGGAPLYQHDRKDFAPRVAFAYNPSYAPKTVFNASASVIYDRTVANALNFIQDQSSYLFQNAVDTPYGGESTSATTDLSDDPRVGTNFTFPANTPPTITEPYSPYVYDGYPYGLGNGVFNDIIDPTLRDPYSIMLTAGVQEQLPWDLVLKVNYVGRLGRRLLAQADASQIIDFPDAASGQELSTAFGNLTKEIRAGQATATPQAWFENQIGPGFTQILYSYGPLAGLIHNGDMGDFVQALASYGLIGTNVGMASQFAENTFITNKGFSSYNGLLLTLSKNLSHGLQFDFNYTWSHAIDNTSLIANVVASSSGIGFVCDATRPRECRGNADFDVTNSLNSYFTYELPFGHDRMFASNTPKWVDEVIGGWDVSGIPAWYSGLAFSALSNAYVAGYANDAPAIFDGNRTAVQPHAHKLSDGSVNLFNNFTAANAAFSGPVGLNIGSRNNLRGPSTFTMNAGVAKTFPLISDRVNLKFRADAFNVLNHPTFGLPNNDITDETASPFGQINGTTTAPRVMQFALRVEF